MVKEDFLHYLWKLQIHKEASLVCSDGSDVVVVSPGLHNLNAGPDFFNAKLLINGQLWAGNVELHVKSSDWYVHAHELDTNYDNVILHVVWEHDMTVFNANNRPIPTLVLPDFVPTSLLQRYATLMQEKSCWISCEPQLGSVNKHLIQLCLERMYIERLEVKTQRMSNRLKFLNNDWEGLMFETIARSFGLNVNADAFESLAQQVGISRLRKVQHRCLSLEALLFGQSGMLNEELHIPYYGQLQNEFHHLTTTLKLTQTCAIPFQFFRLRPPNFPTLRIAQLCALYHKEPRLFSKLMEATDLTDYYRLFDINVSTFWKTHFSFKAKAKSSAKKLTIEFISLVLINTVIPIKFLYLNYLGRFDPAQLLKTMRQLKPEQNKIITKFKALGVSPVNALESQGLLHLRNEYCKPKACLKCPIGSKLITLKKGGWVDIYLRKFASNPMKRNRDCYEEISLNHYPYTDHLRL